MVLGQYRACKPLYIEKIGDLVKCYQSLTDKAAQLLRSRNIALVTQFLQVAAHFAPEDQHYHHQVLTVLCRHLQLCPGAEIQYNLCVRIKQHCCIHYSLQFVHFWGYSLQTPFLISLQIVRTS